MFAGGRAYVMLLGDEGGSLAADVDDNATDVWELLFDAIASKASTTIRAWKPVIFNLKLVIGVLLETFQMRKIPAWVSESKRQSS